MPHVCTIACYSSSHAIRLPKFTPLNLFTSTCATLRRSGAGQLQRRRSGAGQSWTTTRAFAVLMSLAAVMGEAVVTATTWGAAAATAAVRAAARVTTTDYRQGNDSTPFFKECWEAARDLPAAGVLRTALKGGWAKEEKRQQELMQQLEFTVERNKALERLIGGPSSQDVELISMWQLGLSIKYDRPVHGECRREGLYRSG